MKQFVRSFSLGLFVASLIIFIFYNYFDDPVVDTKDLSTEELIELVEEDDYRVITEEEYITYTVNEDQEETDDDKKDDKGKEDKEDKNDEEDEDIIKYTLKIKSGMVSHEVINLLEEEKIIKDSNEFTEFLEENGYSEYFQLGEFKLTNEMSQDEIAKEITNK